MWTHPSDEGVCDGGRPSAFALAAWLPAAPAQEAGAPNFPPLPSPVPGSAPATPAADALLERLRKMEERLDNVTTQSKEMRERLDRVTGQNEDLTRENTRLAGQVQALSHWIGDSRPQATTNEGADGGRSSGMAGAGPGGTTSSVAGDGSTPATAGGGSSSGGGDPTRTGTAQVVGNRHRGKIPLAGGSYDFDNDGFRWGTPDNEISFGVRAMQQLDARIYGNPHQLFASSGIFNPRTRVYFEGHLTKPITYEFSFQETYNTTNLLDSYINYRFSDDQPGSACPRPCRRSRGTGSTSGICSSRSVRCLPTTSKAIAALASRPGEARSTTGWNMPSGLSTVSGNLP